MKKKELTSILKSHKNWLNNKEGKRVDLWRADLWRANLQGANLHEVITNENTQFYEISCPEEGEFIAWKKAQGKLIKLKIPADALRSSATSYKCRASKVEVLEVEGGGKVSSDHDENFIYKEGAILEVKDFDIDRWNECSTGIHFFINKNHAKTW